MSEPEAGLTPRTTQHLLGHAAAEKGFLDLWALGQCPHALLITGPCGIGKATLAFRIARFVLAEDQSGGSLSLLSAPPTSLHLSPDHQVFRQVAAGSHSDLLYLQRLSDEKTGKLKSNISVDQVRAVAGFLHLTSSLGGWRVVIIDTVDDMNPNAANALLKVLEEPPPRTLLLLVSHSPGKLLPTIKSRCRKVTLAPLADDMLTGVLRGLSLDGDPHLLRRLAVLSEGSPGRAQELAAGGGLDLYAEMMGLLAGAEINKLHGFADRLSRAGQEVAFETCRGLLDWWLQRLVRTSAAGQPPQEIVAGEGRAAGRILGAHSLDRLIEVWDKINHLFETALRLNLDKKQVLLSCFEMLAPAGR